MQMNEKIGVDIVLYTCLCGRYANTGFPSKAPLKRVMSCNNVLGE